jgi:frataxin-like iron-binding protein CyaY
MTEEIISVIKKVITETLTEQPVDRIEYSNIVEYELSRRLNAKVDYRDWVDINNVWDKVFELMIDEITHIVVSKFREKHEIEVRTNNSRVCFDIDMEGYLVELGRSNKIIQIYNGCKLNDVTPKTCT